MFRGAKIHLTEPICFCLENKLAWNMESTTEGPSLLVWCTACGARLQVPPKQFKAGFVMDHPYPGKPRVKPAIEFVEPKAGDVVDISEYIRRKREQEPPS